ncbi:MAG: PqqD family protein [Erythrobacter sp.]
MTDILNLRWQISDQAIANMVGEEMVVLHLANGTYFGLDPVGSLLWEALAAGELPAKACEMILDRYEVDRETVEQDLRQFLGELAQGDLIAQA